MFSNFGILKMIMKIKSALALFLIFTICSCANNPSVVSDYRSYDQINKIALYIFEKSENIEKLSEVDLFNFTKYFNDLFSASNAPEILLVDESYKGHHQYLSEATSREDVDAYFVGSWDKDIAEEDQSMARSRHGYFLTYNGIPLQWASQLQTKISLSSTESEFIGLSQALRLVIPVIEILKELK